MSLMRHLGILCVSVILCCSVCPAADNNAMFLNAFGETATAYLNDSFLLLGTTADSFVSDVMTKETALEIATNVQKRIRVVRAKLKTVLASRMVDADKKLLGLLESAYACMDQEAWALSQYIDTKAPSAAKRFEQQRQDCLGKIKMVAEFYSTLPPAPELPEPLSTR